VTGLNPAVFFFVSAASAAARDHAYLLSPPDFTENAVFACLCLYDLLVATVATTRLDSPFPGDNLTDAGIRGHRYLYVHEETHSREINSAGLLRIGCARLVLVL